MKLMWDNFIPAQHSLRYGRVLFHFPSLLLLIDDVHAQSFITHLLDLQIYSCQLVFA